MDYEFLDSSIDKDNIILPNSDKINPFLLKNNYTEIIKAVDFIASDEKFLYLHGFLGTGKRQFINYICEYLHHDVIKLEYYCKESTVCDDILLVFSDIIDNLSISKAVNLNAKITTLAVKFQQQISSIKKPFLIILHSYDDISKENSVLISECMSKLLKEENIKLIISTRAMVPGILEDTDEDRKIFLKALTQENFKEFLNTNLIPLSDRAVEDFYKYTRGYYYYTALSIKIMQAMKISLSEFIQKFNQSGMTFDAYLGFTYINLVPTAIRNFFWFLRSVRHGISLNALAILEIYDEFSIEYLKTNLMIFQSGETLYVQDFFTQKLDLMIPEKTQIKLHKYINSIYEKQLKEPLKSRVLMISRQAMRAEIEYHNQCIYNIEHAETSQETQQEESAVQLEAPKKAAQPEITSLTEKMKTAAALSTDKKYTEAIEAYKDILETSDIDTHTAIEARSQLASLYKSINNYSLASHYYELVENYYLKNKEFINLNYLYYDLTDLYFKMYKNERAIETIKKVIYSVDTPQSLMVNACTLLGNIYSEINNPQEAYNYYKKALESIDDNIEPAALAELYFKFALANDDRNDINQAFEFYNKCIAIVGNNPYKALSYSNLASCYYENDSFEDAKFCFKKAYDIDKENNNYDGIYFNSSKLARIYLKEDSSKALDYLTEAKKSAEFINEEYYILTSTLALGDYYYNYPQHYKDGLKEYFKALKIAQNISEQTEIAKIEHRIKDMKLRMKPEDFLEIENRYGK